MDSGGTAKSLYLGRRKRVDSWAAEIDFERQGILRRILKASLVNPMANYLPAGLLKALLRLGKSELAAANWSDPGGWRSMVISYDGRPRQIADKILVGAGSMAMALRNRKRLGARLLAGLIDSAGHEPAHVLCLGAGPGQIIIDAMGLARRKALATLVDLNNDAFEFGHRLAGSNGLNDNVRFIVGDVRNVEAILDRPADVVKMLGICEYLTDEQIASIARSVAAAMPAGSPIVVNSLSKAHGTDRFFRRVFGLHMNHRSPQAIQELLAPAGFENFTSIPEPLGVYHVIVGHKSARKSSDP